MTPSLFDLPLRPPEAAQLAALIVEQAGDRPITADVRNRIASRSALLKLDTIRAFFASLERDPIHPSAIYVAIDGIGGVPLLLRIAPNATPASGLFPKSILIGRIPGPGGVELVVNAIPFAHTSTEAIRTFSAEVNRAFQARPQGTRSAIIVTSNSPQSVYPAAFDAFRGILKERNLNMAGFADARTASWAAVRAGWREGFVAAGKEPAVPAHRITEKVRAVCTMEIDDARQAPQAIERCSQFLL